MCCRWYSRVLGEIIKVVRPEVCTDAATTLASLCDLGAFLQYVNDDTFQRQTEKQTTNSSRGVSRKRKSRSSESADRDPANRKVPRTEKSRGILSPRRTSIQTSVPSSEVTISADIPNQNSNVVSLSVGNISLHDIPRYVNVEWEPFEQHLAHLGISSVEKFSERMRKLDARFHSRIFSQRKATNSVQQLRKSCI